MLHTPQKARIWRAIIPLIFLCPILIYIQNPRSPFQDPVIAPNPDAKKGWDSAEATLVPGSPTRLQSINRSGARNFGFSRPDSGPADFVEARNSSQGFDIRASEFGIRVTPENPSQSNWHWEVNLLGYSIQSDSQNAEDTRPRESSNRIEF